MDIVNTIILSVVQGVTEFLPVSSSGHLLVFRNLLKVPPVQALALDVSLHVGTLISICVFFRRDLRALGASLFTREPSVDRSLERRRLLFLFLASVSTALVGFSLKGGVEEVNSFLPAAAVGFLLTTCFLLAGEMGGTSRVNESITEMAYWHPLLLGVVQGMAVWPGLSRSGATIGLALLIGWSWSDAGRFSFLMAIPAVAGAVFLTAREMVSLPHPGIVLTGVVISFFTGLAALTILMRFLAARRLWPFAVYTTVLALYCFVK